MGVDERKKKAGRRKDVTRHTKGGKGWALRRQTDRIPYSEYQHTTHPDLNHHEPFNVWIQCTMSFSRMHGLRIGSSLAFSLSSMGRSYSGEEQHEFE